MDKYLRKEVDNNDKRMIILIVMGLTLSSCQLFTEAIKR